MGKFYGIISLREIKKEVFRDVVYEWEDQIARIEKVPIVNVDNISVTERSDRNIFERIYSFVINKKQFNKLDKTKPIYFAFLTLVNDVLYVQNKNCIPVFIDVWNDRIDYVRKKMSNGTPFFVTSLDVYEKLKGASEKLDVYYLPLSVSDIWKSDLIPKKTIDLVQVGRKNEVLHNFALEYIKTHPTLEYVYSGKNGTTGDLKYFSTTRGEIGAINTRKDYMDLLKNSHICLLSSPGVDSSRKNAEDIDFPTPRFYETAASYCIMLTRHSNHKEFEIQGIDSICYSINSYEQFSAIMDRIGAGEIEVDTKKYGNFIEKHLTSTWYSEFKEKMKGFIS
ncbi:hypothetical protein C8U37_10243 [Trichococcus patagoniensis]|uniref:Glycosyl transferase family 1 n=1 Tax=Trichococcus patagoniensis TaxID=382641 RepID=A0A2T5IQ76_9LACT|nr:hypothetical protein [Trichococcus patagoniensis]PTQ85940.1 hypothetical protein C8U37_10243 [Trichococcus patagoniensis]